MLVINRSFILFCVTYIYILTFFFSLFSYAAEVESDPEALAIWQRVRQGNRIWLEVINREVSYELVVSESNRGVYKTKKIWYRGPAQARIEQDERPGSALNGVTIYSDGYYVSLNMPQYYRLEPVPYGLGIGFSINPPFLNLLMDSNPLLQYEGKKRLFKFQNVQPVNYELFASRYTIGKSDTYSLPVEEHYISGLKLHLR